MTVGVEGQVQMKKAIVVTLLIAGAVVLEACAESDGGAGAPDPEPGGKLPEADAGDAGPGADAAAPDPCRPDTLCPNDLFGPEGSGKVDLRTRINVIRGRSASDVWAGGAAGAVVHFDGAAWTRSETNALESIRGFWLRGSGELALVSMSPAAALVRGLDLEPADGAQPSTGGWLRVKSSAVPTSVSKNLTSAWGAPNAKWVWGTTGSVDQNHTGENNANGVWRARIDTGSRAVVVDAALPAGACKVLGCWWMSSIHGASADELWAVGRNGTTIHVTNAEGDAPEVAAVDSRTWAMLYGVWAAGPNEAFAVGGRGTIRHFVGGDVRDGVTDAPVTEDLRAVWGTSSADVWAVGDDACVLHFDGTRWSRVAVTGLDGRRPDLYAVWTTEPGHVWAGGDGVLLSIGGKP